MKPSVQLSEFKDFPFEGLKSWGALTLLFRKGFRGSYAEVCQELGWLDRNGKPMKSMVSRAIRHAKDKGGIPKDASIKPEKVSAENIPSPDGNLLHD